MPSEFGFEQRSPRYGPFLVLGVVTQTAHNLGHFLPFFLPFLGHIVELEGTKGVFDRAKTTRTWLV